MSFQDPTQIDFDGLPPVVGQHTGVVEMQGHLSKAQLQKLKQRLGVEPMDKPSFRPDPAPELTEGQVKANLGAFDRVVVINLTRRTDRYADFVQRIQAVDWPFIQPERHLAVDGQTTTAPEWWKQGSNAWACLQSHLQVLKQAQAEGVERLLVLEDDATPYERIGPEFARFRDELPGEWDMLYLGGQHLQPPMRINDYVLQVNNGHRAHAYAVRGSFLPTLIAHLEDHEAEPWGEKHHMDHRIGVLHETGRCRAYAPTLFQFGQAASKSDINGAEQAEQWWQPKVQKLAAPMIGRGVRPPVAAGVKQGDLVVFNAYGGKTVADDALRAHAQTHGMGFHQITGWERWGQSLEAVNAVRLAGLVVIWHGDEPGCDQIKALCRRHKKPWVIAENGLLPQAGHFHLDPEGIVGRSSLMKTDALEWVTDEDLDRADRHIKEHFEGMEYEPDTENPYILCPLQMEADASILYHSPYATMGEFLEAVRAEFPGRRIVATPHPRQPGAAPEVPGVEIAHSPTTIEFARRAERVIGINSTVLYETAALGCPTAAWGDCPLKVWVTAEERRYLLAAVIARQIPKDSEDLTDWLSRLV